MRTIYPILVVALGGMAGYFAFQNIEAFLAWIIQNIVMWLIFLAPDSAHSHEN